MVIRRIVMPVSISVAAFLLVAVMAALSAAGCRQQVAHIDEKGGFAMSDFSDCLPDITLIDQHGQKISLSSLRGKPVLFDFIYTSCPGPCLLLTSLMKSIAIQLGPALGKEARIVSVTVDPEHDHPEQLLAYAKEFRADVKGWSFLTGTPKQIDEVMARFNLFRGREADGTVDHVLEFFLVGANGHALLQYIGDKAAPERVASDMARAAAGESVTAREGAHWSML
jgi:protein SCO1